MGRSGYSEGAKLIKDLAHFLAQHSEILKKKSQLI